MRDIDAMLTRAGVIFCRPAKVSDDRRCAVTTSPLGEHGRCAVFAIKIGQCGPCHNVLGSACIVAFETGGGYPFAWDDAVVSFVWVRVVFCEPATSEMSHFGFPFRGPAGIAVRVAGGVCDTPSLTHGIHRNNYLG